MHGELKIIVDEDDKVSEEEMMRKGAVAFRPHAEFGKTEYKWQFGSRNKTIETLRQVLELLQK